MKKIFILCLSFSAIAVSSFSQKKMFSFKNTRNLLGIHLNTLDIQTPQVWKDNSAPRTLATLKDQNLGFSLSAWKQISDHIDLTARLGMLFHNFSAIDRNENVTNYNKVGVEIEPTASVKIFPDAYKFNAFVTTGLGIGSYSGKMGAYIPVGLGLQANLSNKVYIMLQSQLRKSLSDGVMKNSIMHSIGIAQPLNMSDFKRK
jgi:hypothetical protein